MSNTTTSSTEALTNYDEVRQHVVDNSNVATLTMGTLRDVHGAGKLGVNVRANISKELRSRGLAHIPAGELPSYYWDPVRLYVQGSPVGDLIDAVLTVSPDRDDQIRDTVNTNETDLLAKVREIVGA